MKFSPYLERELTERKLLHIVPDTSQGMAMLIEPDGELAGFFTVAFCKDWCATNPDWRFDAIPTNRAR